MSLVLCSMTSAQIVCLARLRQVVIQQGCRVGDAIRVLPSALDPDVLQVFLRSPSGPEPMTLFMFWYEGSEQSLIDSLTLLCAP